MSAIVLFHGGAPNYRHDWQWPELPEQFRTWSSGKILGWHWVGSGSTTVGVQIHPFFAVLPGLDNVLQGLGTLAAILSLIGVTSAAGMMWLVSRYTRSPYGIISAGIAYALSPVVVNKLVAGHVLYLIAFAVVPCAIAALDRKRWLLAALCFAVCAIHIQVLFFATLLALPFVRPGRFSWRHAAGIALVVATVAPFIWSLVHQSQIGLARQFKTSYWWELDQSTDFENAITGIGYFPHYWTTATQGIFGAVLPWMYLIGITGALIFSRSHIRWLLAALYALGVFWLWGLRGPLAATEAALFEHVLWTSTFRELYHAAILISFTGAFALALTIDAVPRSLLRAAACALLVCIILDAWMQGRILAQTDVERNPSSLAQLADELAKPTASSLFFLAPGFNPTGRRGTDFGGADPLAYPVGDRIPWWSYRPAGYEGAIIWTLSTGGAAAADLARWLGIDLMIGQPGLVSKLAPTTAYPGIPHIPEFPGAFPVPPGWKTSLQEPRVSVAEAPESNGIVQLLNGSAAPLFSATPQVAPIARDRVEPGAAPKKGWAPINDWWFLSPALAVGAPDGIMTESLSTELRLRCSDGNAKSLSVMALGKGRLNGERFESTIWETRTLPCDHLIPVSAMRGNYVAVTRPEDIRCWGEIKSSSKLEPLALKAHRHGDELLAVADAACAQCTLRLAQVYDTRWQLSVGAKRIAHFAKVGEDNRWIVTLRPGDRIVLRYADPTLGYLERFAAVAWVLLALLSGHEALASLLKRRGKAAHAPGVARARA